MYQILDILFTVNNSSYEIAGRSVVGIDQNGGYAQPSPTAIIDVTDTSQVKVRFRTQYANTSQTRIRGNSGSNYTYFTFTRIADT